MIDNRVSNNAEVEKIRNEITAALLINNVVAYAVEYQGTLVTALAYRKTETEAVPLCILLPESAWATAPHMTHTHGPTKDSIAS